MEKTGPNAGLYYDVAGKGMCKNKDCTDCKVPNPKKTPGPVVYDTQCRSMDFVGLGDGVKAPSWNFKKGECPKKPEPMCRVTYKGEGCKGDVTSYTPMTAGGCQMYVSVLIGCASSSFVFE